MHCLFCSYKNKHGFYRGEDPIKRFCADLRKIATEIINCKKTTKTKKEKINTFDKETTAEIQKTKILLHNICKQELDEIFIEGENYWKITGKFRGAAHSICYLRFKTPTENPAVFHNDSN